MTWEAKELRPLVRDPKTHQFLGLDTEDDQCGFGKGRGFYLGAVYGPQGGMMFDNRHDLIRYLCQPRWSRWWIACHNLEYDLLNVFGVIGLVANQVYFSGSKLCGMRIRVGEKPRDEITFVDTSSFLAEPLKKLAPLVGEEKIDCPIPPRGRRVITKQLIEYCMQDAKVAWKLANFIQDGIAQLGGEMKLTAAATSLDLFRRKYLREALPRVDERMQVAMHRGYSGGRVECFRLGEIEGPVFQNDVNGAYVSVMIDTEYPDLGKLKERQGRHADLSLQGMAECELTVPDHLWAPPLPLKEEKLTFPTGKLKGTWAYNELRQALNYGVKIAKVHRCWEASRSHPYLRDMMLALRAIRENPATPVPVSRMAKLLGNSLYGKFAQRNEDFYYADYDAFRAAIGRGQLIPGKHYDPARTRIYEHCGKVKVVTGTRFPVHANVAWSAITTAGCRCLLYPYIEESDTFYCDTDSVIGYKDYPKTKQLGKLAHQHSYSRVIIRGNKLYAGLEEKEGKEKWNAHAKGIPRDQAEFAVLNPGKVIRSRRPVKIRTALAGGGTENDWIEVHKQLSGDYDKRQMLPDGTTRPHKVLMW